MNIRRMFKTMAVSTIMALTVSALAVAAPVKLTILHINDLHGRLESFSVAKDQPMVGGVARISTLIKQVKAENPNTLILSAGDSIHGTNIANFDKGQAVVEVMGTMGFSAMATGNHEYNYGIDRLIELGNKAYADYGMKFLAADVKNDSGINPFSSVREMSVGGLKLAIIGVAAPETPVVTHPDNVRGYTFPDAIAVARKYVNIFRDSNDLVILLSHAGFDLDKKIAESVPGIDVIVGGHSHTKLDAPVMVGKTMIVQAGEYGQFLGRVDLEVEKGKILKESASLITVNDKTAEDADIVKIIAPYKEKVDKALSNVVGNTSVVLDGVRGNVRTKETNLGNLVADIMRTAGKADVAITNGGGIRDSIDVGEITLNEVFKVLPFDNTLITIKITGKQILEALENAVTDYPKEAGKFAQVSGLNFVFDQSKPAGQRVVSVTVGSAPLDPSKTYLVATNDFMAAGGDGYTTFSTGGKAITNNLFLREVAADFLRAAGTVAPKVEGRITVK